ncbi:immunoglobulin-like domain-containing protein [Bacteroidota bacterium]
MRQAIYTCFVFIIIFAGCRKKDEAPPTFQIIGDSTVSINLFTEYSDSGVIINDNKSGFFIDTINTVENDEIGEYIIKYVAVDDEGNIGTFTRRVKVIVVIDNMIGQYHVNETVSEGPSAGDYVYTLTVTKNSSNNGLLMSFFGGWGSSAVANATITEDGEIDIPQQEFHEGTLSGSGTINKNAKSFTIDYTYNYADGTDVSHFTASYIEEDENK